MGRHQVPPRSPHEHLGIGHSSLVFILFLTSPWTGVFWVSMPNPPVHFKFCKELPSLFPLLEEQGYQRGLAMEGSVCLKSEFCDFQALTFQYLSAWRHSPGRCTAPGSVWVDTAVIPLIFLQFWFYLVQPHRMSRGVGKTCADPIPAPISSSPSFRIMHDEVSETENIRKNLAIERMIIEGCEILLDTSQTFVRQGLCRHQRPSPLR